MFFLGWTPLLYTAGSWLQNLRKKEDSDSCNDCLWSFFRTLSLCIIYEICPFVIMTNFFVFSPFNRGVWFIPCIHEWWKVSTRRKWALCVYTLKGSFWQVQSCIRLEEVVWIMQHCTKDGNSPFVSIGHVRIKLVFVRDLAQGSTSWGLQIQNKAWVIIFSVLQFFPLFFTGAFQIYFCEQKPPAGSTSWGLQMLKFQNRGIYVETGNFIWTSYMWRMYFEEGFVILKKSSNWFCHTMV